MDYINSYIALTGESPVVAPRRVATTRAATFQTSTRFSCLVLGLIALVYVGTCFAPVIFDDNEGLYAGAVREMHQSGTRLVLCNQ